MNQCWDEYHLHAFEKPEKDSEPLYELCPQLFGPYWRFTDQNIPERDTSYILDEEFKVRNEDLKLKSLPV